MQLTSGSLAAIVGLALALTVGGVTVAARSGGDRSASLRIESLANPAPASAGRAATTTTARQAPTPPPTPPPPKSFFDTHQIVAYYGNPYSATMGILGEYQGDELVRRVKAQAAKHQELNPERTVVAALHLVYAVAQARPGPDGSYITHMPDEMVEGLIELTRANGMIFFIDLQNGRLNPVEEAKRVRKWLVNEHVHLAVDPEFTFRPGETPQEDIGQIDASVINGIQDVLQEVALDARVGNKILIVHQFRPDMIENKPLIAKDRDRVDVVLNMDGWGRPPNKLSKYQAHVTNEPVEYAGIKMFYRWDEPLLTEAEVQKLTPRPNYIQYQ